MRGLVREATARRPGSLDDWLSRVKTRDNPRSDRQLGRRSPARRGGPGSDAHQQQQRNCHLDGPLLRLRGIGKNFGPVHALTDIDLDIPAGQVTALVGDNGAGKSTLIKTIAGIWEPSHGEIIWQGQPVHFRTPKDATQAGIATVYQDLALCDNLDIVQNMLLGHEVLRHLLLDEITMEKTAKKTLADLRVTTVRNIRQPVGSLSGGQRQAVAVAKAVMLDAKLVIMDEPTAALGVSQTALVLDLIEPAGQARHRGARDLAQPDRRVPGRRPARRAVPRPPGVERPGRRLRHRIGRPPG